MKDNKQGQRVEKHSTIGMTVSWTTSSSSPYGSKEK